MVATRTAGVWALQIQDPALHIFLPFLPCETKFLLSTQPPRSTCRQESQAWALTQLLPLMPSWARTITFIDLNLLLHKMGLISSPEWKRGNRDLSVCQAEASHWALYSIFKSRDITLPTKVHLVKTMVFPVVMYGCESWTIKKAEHWRIDAFELWCWRRLLRVPSTARSSNQSIPKEISLGGCLEGMMLKLKLQYFGHLIRRVDSLEKTLMLGGIWGRRRRGRQKMRWLVASLTWWTWVWVNSGSWW